MGTTYVCKQCGKEMYSHVEFVEYWGGIYCKKCNPDKVQKLTTPVEKVHVSGQKREPNNQIVKKANDQSTSGRVVDIVKFIAWTPIQSVLLLTVGETLGLLIGLYSLDVGQELMKKTPPVGVRYSPASYWIDNLTGVIAVVVGPIIGFIIGVFGCFLPAMLFGLKAEQLHIRRKFFLFSLALVSAIASSAAGAAIVESLLQLKFIAPRLNKDTVGAFIGLLLLTLWFFWIPLKDLLSKEAKS